MIFQDHQEVRRDVQRQGDFHRGLALRSVGQSLSGVLRQGPGNRYLRVLVARRRRLRLQSLAEGHGRLIIRSLCMAGDRRQRPDLHDAGPRARLPRHQARERSHDQST